MKITVQHGDALTFQADVLALKYAQHLYGVDRAVCERFAENGEDLTSHLPEVEDVELVKTHGILGAGMVLFVGVPQLDEFGYAEIEAFSKQVLRTLVEYDLNVKHLCLTLHGVGVGLDETAAFTAELKGITSAIAEGAFPQTLTRITIVEQDLVISARLEYLLFSHIPHGIFPWQFATGAEALTRIAAAEGKRFEIPARTMASQVASAVSFARHLLWLSLVNFRYHRSLTEAA